MDSEDDLPALEPVYNGDHLPPPVNVTGGVLQSQSDSEVHVHASSVLEEQSNDDPPASISSRHLNSPDIDDEYMPELMAVSDSSDEQDDLEDNVDDDSTNSEWEDEDDAEFENDYLPPLEPVSGATVSTTGEDGLENMPSLLPSTPPPDHHPTSPRRNDPSWLPPRRSPSVEVPSLFRVTNTTRVRTMLDVLHLGPVSAGNMRPGNLTDDLIEHIVMQGMIGQEESRPLEPDPERAKVLIHGLEIVPEGLLARMIRVGGAPGAHEDLSGDEQNDIAGCAVCWAPLLDDEQNDPGADDGRPIPFSAQVGGKFEIVSLPCAHVFHAACLLPWFSRPGTTTCPTCRFDIDPDALTWKTSRPSRPGSSESGRNNPAGNSVPIDDWEDQTDVDGDSIDEDEDELLEAVTGLDELLVNSIFGSMGMHSERRRRAPRGTWTLPDAPGKTLRERIVEMEREMGLRCVDVTCVLAPTDEDPYPPGTDFRQISIRANNASKCRHTLHPACLVMSARVAGRSSPPESKEMSGIEVSCPSCRTIGIVSKEEWDEGVEALALVDS